MDESDWAAVDPAGYWQSKYEETKARLAEAERLIAKIARGHGASDHRCTWQDLCRNYGSTADSASGGEA